MQLLSEDSFLRKLYANIAPIQRVAFQGIGFSFDAMTLAYGNMREAAAAIAATREIPSAEATARLFSSAWDIVTYAQMARKLMLQLALDHAELVAYCDAAADATILRNRQHHIFQNLGNLAQRKGHHPSLFGTMSFALVEPRHLTTSDGQRVLKGCVLITVESSLCLNTTAEIIPKDFAKDLKIEMPVGRFRFQAFDKIVDLSALLRAAAATNVAFDGPIRQSFISQLTELAKDQGVDPDAALKQTGSRIRSELEIGLGDHPFVSRDEWQAQQLRGAGSEN